MWFIIFFLLILFVVNDTTWAFHSRCYRLSRGTKHAIYRCNSYQTEPNEKPYFFFRDFIYFTLLRRFIVHCTFQNGIITRVRSLIRPVFQTNMHTELIIDMIIIIITQVFTNYHNCIIVLLFTRPEKQYNDNWNKNLKKLFKYFYCFLRLYELCMRCKLYFRFCFCTTTTTNLIFIAL